MTVPVLSVAICPQGHPFPPTGGAKDEQKCPYCGASTRRIVLWGREQLVVSEHGLATTMQASLLWLEIAIEHQRAAHAASGGQPPAALVAGNQDAAFKASLVTITAACHAIDGVYGMALTAIERSALPVGDNTPRPFRVLEGLKAAFHVGRQSQQWAKEFKWLFKTRDDAVHHGHVPLRLVKEGSAHERAAWSVDAADRAVALAVDVLTSCANSPRAESSTATEWAAVAAAHLQLVLPPSLQRGQGE